MVNKLDSICCQKVLPLVYDESLSYYELLCKLIDKQNEIIDYIDGTISETSYQLISAYLINLFASMIYTEDTKNINFKFDEIIKDGYHSYNESTQTITVSNKLGE